MTEVAAGTTAIVLAAGKGTRMKSELPKVLFPVLGKPMIHWVIDALEGAGIRRIVVVVGYRADDVRAELAKRPKSPEGAELEFALQEQQLGTGHAVQMCVPLLQAQTSAQGPVLVLAGDSPLVQTSSISELLAAFREGKYACLLGTLLKDNPEGLGRIVRDTSGHFQKIVEHKDATQEQRAIREVNMSTYVFDKSRLISALGQLSNNNSQSEYYLTDCPAILLRAGDRVDALATLKSCEALSINTIDELAAVENKMKELGYPCVS
jgi:bifunctional UDP-N-acetylglucosamine pyrophosphorylase/glucosamine-1-phosphate N-acetyltransferase/UDP-N-acetylglucosamine pyrophosphorylase